MLSILFTIGFYYLFVIIPLMLHEILLPSIPDPYYNYQESRPLYDSAVEEFSLKGSFIFFIVIILIILGVIIKQFKLSFLGSFTLYLPIFAHFCIIMFMFAGIGLTRLLWYPIIQINPSLLKLGDFISPLYFLGEDLFDIIDEFIPPSLSDFLYFRIFFQILFYIVVIWSSIFIGLGIFVFSIITWFYGKFSDKHLLDFWIYKYSRHPQYLGLLLWSYGLTILFSLPFEPGEYIPSPTIIWLICALFVIGAAIQEENHLMIVLKEEHETWRQTTPFLLPLPGRATNGIQWLIRQVIRKDWPSNNKEILMVLAFFGILIISSSVLFQFVYYEILYDALRGFNIDWSP